MYVNKYIYIISKYRPPSLAPPSPFSEQRGHPAHTSSGSSPAGSSRKLGWYDGGGAHIGVQAVA